MTPSHGIAQTHYTRILSIAGSDSGGGAGIQADLKTFAALGCFGMTAITAITAQNTCGVTAIHEVSPAILRDQIDAVVQDIGTDAVKIGMLHSREMVQTVAQAIDRHQLSPVVLDPVMVATSGAVLIDQDAIRVLVQELFPRVTVITPNLDEAALLAGFAITSTTDMARAAQVLLDCGARAALIKGGHLSGDVVFDLLMTDHSQPLWFESPRIASRNTHGTGCTLSSAIAAWLALGTPLEQAVEQARNFVRQALEAGAHVTTGRGSGPLNHGFAPVMMRVSAALTLPIC